MREADRILVFNQSRIAEQSKHAELILAHGLYVRLNAMSRGDALAEEAVWS